MKVFAFPVLLIAIGVLVPTALADVGVCGTSVDEITDVCYWESGCHYYGTAYVTAGPTPCKQNALRSEKTVSCPSQPGPKTCSFSRTETKTQKFTLVVGGGINITYADFDLSADYAIQEVVQVACSPSTTIGPLICDCPYPPNQDCCEEYWERRVDTTMRKPIYQKLAWTTWYGFPNDVGYCDADNRTGGDMCCYWEGTLRTIEITNCSDCTNLTACNP